MEQFLKCLKKHSWIEEKLLGIFLPFSFFGCLCTNLTRTQISVYTVATSLELFSLVVNNQIKWIGI